MNTNILTPARRAPFMAKERILVVDDEEDLLELVKYNLTKEGYRVACVASGEEAIQRARTDLPDLMVLDLLLPNVDGLEVCRVLKNDARTKHIPVIILTAKGEEAEGGDEEASAQAKAAPEKGAEGEAKAPKAKPAKKESE